MANFTGDNLDNLFTGGLGNETILGNGGNDTLSGGGGADSISGGDGADVLSGDNGNDTLHGGNDDDSIAGGANNDFLYGDAGNDTLDGGANNDLLDGGAGNDSLNGGLGDDTLYFKLGEGNDTLAGGAGFNSLTLDIASSQLTAAVRADLAALVAWIGDQANTPAVTLSALGLNLREFNYVNVIVDGTNVDINSLLTAPASPPAAAAAVSITTAEDTPFAGQVDATDPQGDVLVWSVIDGPQFGTLTLDPTTGAYTYGTAQNFSGDDSFVVRVTDADGLATDQTVNVTVTGVADVPLVQTASTSISLDSSLNGNAANATLTGGTGADLIKGGDGNEVITGDDTSVARVIVLDIAASLADLDGSEMLSVRISDLPSDSLLSAGKVNLDGSWTLTPAELAGLTLSTATATGFTLTVDATSTESNGDKATATTTLDVAITSSGSNDTLSGGAGDDTITGNAGNDIIDGGSGSNSLDGGIGNDTFTHVVGAGIDATTGGEGSDTVVISLTSADLSLGVRSDFGLLDAFLQAQLASAGSAAALAAQASGDTLTMANLGLTISTVESVVVMLDGVQVELKSLLNHAPQANAQVIVAATEDAQLVGQLAATDADNDALTWQLLQGPAHGTLALDTSGHFSYTGATNFGGADSFTVRVSDPLGAYTDQKVDLAVAAVTDAPTLQASLGTSPVGGSAAGNSLGTTGNDTITGSGGNDVITAKAGDDLVFGDGGAVNGPLALNIAASLSDTDGSETLSIRVTGMPSGATLSAGTLHSDGSWWLDPPQLAGLTISAAPGSSFTLTVEATATEHDGGSNTVAATVPVSFASLGGVGNDTIDAGVGNDTVYVGGGNDIVRGGDGNDLIFDGDGNDLVNGGRGNDVLYNGGGDDKVHGGWGDDTIYDAAGNDSLWGGRGNDLIVASTGANRYDGGDGFDTLDLSKLSGPLTIDLSKGRISGISTSQVQGIESVIGNDQSDTFIGTSRSDVFKAGAGNDMIRGGGGADILTGGAGRDVFSWTKDDVNGRGHDDEHGRGDDHGQSSFGPDTITDFGAGDRLDLHGLLSGMKYKALADVVHVTDNAWGTTVSVKVDSKFVDVVKLAGFHDSSVSHMAAGDMFIL